MSITGRTSAAVLAGLILACSSARDATDVNDAAERVAFEPDFTIGVEDGDSVYLFGAIVSVAADAHGRVYVGDRIGASVRAYDGDGRFLARIARAGEGPGEIAGWPADIIVAADGRLYVRDASRITVFAPRTDGGIADSTAGTWPVPLYGNLASTRSRVGANGDYYYPNQINRQGKPPTYFYLPFRNGTTTGDTIEVPAYPGITANQRASYRVSANSGRLLSGLSHVPFAAVPSWDLTFAGTILSSDGAIDRLIETTVRGDTLRIMDGPTRLRRPIPAAERADSLRALEARLDSLPVPIDEVMGLGEGVRERRLPDYLPAIVAIHVAEDRSIWVERWPAEGQGDARFYDVLDPDGRFRSSVVLKAPLERNPPPWFGVEFIAGVIRDADTGVERVVRFSLGQRVPVAR